MTRFRPRIPRPPRLMDPRIFAECVRTGRWPGYGERVHPVALPPWAFTREQEAEELSA